LYSICFTDSLHGVAVGDNGTMLRTVNGGATWANVSITSETVIALGHKLDMEVVAEGIETISVFSRLQTMGCNHFQGYLFSRPLPSNELVNWEKTRSRKIMPLHLPESSLLPV